jgi:hypothetical protein
MKVKIIKARKSSYWYANKIGCIFEVKETTRWGKREYEVINNREFMDNKYYIEIGDTIDIEHVKVILI